MIRRRLEPTVPPTTAPIRVDLPTRLAHLPSGVVEHRFERRGDEAVLVLHGGHLRAGFALGEDVFADGRHSVLVPSRPGYGRTPLSTGATPDGFADSARELCEHLGITRLAAVVGVSAGGPTALALAARHPDLVARVVLWSAVGALPWPDRRTRLAARAAFSPATERLVWTALRGLLRVSPDAGLRSLLGDLSTLPAGRVLAALSAEQRAALVALFGRMRSGAGFRNDLVSFPDRVPPVGQPALVVASRRDGSVPFAHAEALVAALPRAELLESRADSHFVWLGPDWGEVGAAVREFAR
ncbi:MULTISPECIES: alpha/beta fold hydrolase [Actinosynnema]|uniref:alpha/beta fold hydrolase n=1 Tax=Actinosynnema TaxID=40566 RepID=UPI0020A2F7BD|nr:alpha/beta hydrolase [Actinosynnema pretiosum]